MVPHKGAAQVHARFEVLPRELSIGLGLPAPYESMRHARVKEGWRVETKQAS